MCLIVTIKKNFLIEHCNIKYEKRLNIVTYRQHKFY